MNLCFGRLVLIDIIMVVAMSLLVGLLMVVVGKLLGADLDEEGFACVLFQRMHIHLLAWFDGEPFLEPFLARINAKANAIDGDKEAIIVCPPSKGFFANGGRLDDHSTLDIVQGDLGGGFLFHGGGFFHGGKITWWRCSRCRW